MARKGLALEMVIMMIILLVVAAVIIQIFLSQTDPNKLGGIGSRGKCNLELENFKDRCKQICDSYRVSPSGAKATEYCEAYYGMDSASPQLDANCDGKINSVAEVDFGDFKLQACENRIYCFMVTKCQNFDAIGCMDALCRSYTSKYKGDVAEATKTVKRKILTGESDMDTNCRLPTDKDDNWYIQFNFATQKIGASRYDEIDLCS